VPEARQEVAIPEHVPGNLAPTCIPVEP
jgi:hypothetical protein